MFKWLQRWRRSSRDIFKYHDGTKTRWIDPLVAQDAMFSDPDCNPARDFGGADDRDDDSLERVISMACRVFDVQRWSENTPGLTVNELNSLVFNFMTYMTDIKKKYNRLQTQSEPTESELPTTGELGSTTKQESGSSSIPNEQSADAPMCS